MKIIVKIRGVKIRVGGGLIDSISYLSYLPVPTATVDPSTVGLSAVEGTRALWVRVWVYRCMGGYRVHGC
jgi:hypothetical protein